MKFKEKYPNLSQFFAGYFPDADFDGLTDEQVVEIFLIDCKKSTKSLLFLQKTKIELTEFIKNYEFYWQDVSLETNIFFATPFEVLEWLNNIKEQLEK